MNGVSSEIVKTFNLYWRWPKYHIEDVEKAFETATGRNLVDSPASTF